MIVVNDLWKTFPVSREKRKESGGRSSGRVDAVAGVSFTCRPGRIFTLLGPNGAGKTTTLRLIASLIKPTKGSIEVAGFDTVTRSQEVRRRLGFLTGSTKLYERLTPNELIRYYADLHSMDPRKFAERKEKLVAMLGMKDFLDRRIGKLSGGMRQKVSIARTIIHDPEIVVFDEPTVGLDVITSQNIIALIQQCRDEGKTVIFSTHIMGEVSLLSDDMAVIHNGKLLYNGAFDAFRTRMAGDSLEKAFIRLLEEAA